jgi:4-oxalocrotonate tautomerase family enzyme
MPTIMFYGPVTEMTTAQKKELVKLLTDSAVKVTGIPAPHYTVMLRPAPVDQVAIGGELLSEAPHLR